ncbi:MAG: HEAT repeat domain-containing protein [Bryobacteraceae bacterium]
MTCAQVQMNLSLYLYGELDFSEEEMLELHLTECALCKRALEREKSWHSMVNAEQVDVPLEFLSACRNELNTALPASRSGKKNTGFSWQGWARQFGFSLSAWSTRTAVASFLVLAGFTAGRWIDRYGLPNGFSGFGGSEAGLLDPSTAHIRDIQASGNNRVRIIFDQVHEREITGGMDEDEVRRLLIAASKDPSDPGIRVDSVEILNKQNGSDVRDALAYAAQHDPNAGVRLKALQGLGRFVDDPATRQNVVFVLQHDKNSDVRSQAIDVLASVPANAELSPQLAATLQDIVRSEQGDNYVRTRCMQLLMEMNALRPDVY